MADDNKTAAQAFLEAWSAEFEKSVEMFTGQPVKLEHSGEAKSGSTFDSGTSMLWQGQTFKREETGTVWIGTPMETCAALMQASAEDSASAESLYREALRQSFEGAAHILSSGRTPRIVCEQAIEDRSPTLADLACAEPAWVLRPDGQRSPILVAIQPGFAALLREDEQLPAERPTDALEVSRTSTRLDRMADLELPISIVLGRTKLQIQEVLKLTAGSLVELNRGVGESVEVIVHNLIVARGEVVSVGGNYGVRIQEVISRRDRVALHAAGVPRSVRVSHQASVN